MNNIRISEANQNFTGLTRKVDAEGSVGIEKNGKLKYIMMTRERYEDMNERAYYGKAGDELIKVEIREDRAWVYSVLLEKGEYDRLTYTIAEFPADILELREKGGVLTVRTDLDERKEGTKASVIAAEAFLDENGRSIALPEEPTADPDIFEANCIRKCVDIARRFEDAPAAQEVDAAVTRRGRKIIPYLAG